MAVSTTIIAAGVAQAWQALSILRLRLSTPSMANCATSNLISALATALPVWLGAEAWETHWASRPHQQLQPLRSTTSTELQTQSGKAAYSPTSSLSTGTYRAALPSAAATSCTQPPAMCLARTRLAPCREQAAERMRVSCLAQLSVQFVSTSEGE